MKKMLMALGGILLLIGMTGGLMKWQRIGPLSDDGVTAEAETPDLSELDEPPTFIDMDPIVINIFRDDEVVGNMQFAVKLEIVGSDAHRIVDRRMAKLVDAYLRDLSFYIPRYLLRADQLDLGVIMKRLKGLSDDVMGPGVVKQVLIHAMMDNQPKIVPKK